MDSKTTITCNICLGDPKLPVTVQCGHIFCWNCLKQWLNQKSKLECPVCRNGIEEDKIIKLFTDKEENANEIDDRPKAKKIDPTRNVNRPNIFKRFLNNFGVFGTATNNINSEENLELPDPKEAKRNILSLIVFIVAIGMLYSFIKE